MTCLEQHLLEFDGKAISCLSEAQVACGDAADYLDDLIRLCADPRPLVSAGATWILKAELETGKTLPDAHRDSLVQALPGITAWQATLHLMQVVDRLILTAEQGEVLAGWARQYADHKRPFLRAWSLHARVTLAHRFPRPDNDLQALLSEADQDQVASVRARARQLRKALQLPEP